MLDFHGHSRRHGYFFYGCAEDTPASLLQAQLLPFLISQKSTLFAFDNCNYKIAKDREGTERVALHRLLAERRRTALVYTVECSFKGQTGGKNWLIHDYTIIGN